MLITIGVTAKKTPKVIILCFHDIDGKGKYSIKSKELESIFNLVNKNNYKVLNLRQWDKLRIKKGTIDRNMVIFTFDDGYRSLFRNVIPLLTKFKFAATFFIYLDRYNSRSKFYQNLASLPINLEVGAHSFSHSHLKVIKKSKIIYQELFLAKKKLEYLISKPVYSFAWPYGSYSKKLVELAKLAGYKLQVSTSYRSYYWDESKDVYGRFTITKKNPINQVKKILKQIGGLGF